MTTEPEINWIAPPIAIIEGMYGIDRTGKKWGPFETKQDVNELGGFTDGKNSWFFDGHFISFPNRNPMDIIRVADHPFRIETVEKMWQNIYDLYKNKTHAIHETEEQAKSSTAHGALRTAVPVTVTTIITEGH